MQRVNFEYSLKNIPNSSENTYFRVFISKLESFMNRIRWKALFFDQNKEESETDSDDSDETQRKENFGFKTDKVPPSNKDLDYFEDDLMTLMKNITFKKKKDNQFQKKLRNDVKMINNTNELFVSADKTNNMYLLKTDH